jgi:uncharacterized protein
LPEDNYTPPFFFGNGHIQTIFPLLFRKVDGVLYERERIATHDKDFLDLDWSANGHDRLAVISHGLEGCTHRAYVKGMVKAVNKAGWDALAWNYRSCSEEPNRLIRSYHNGVTDDLARVIDHAKQKRPYKEIALIGFSLGGNLTLLHLGKEIPDPIVKKAVVFSVPCDLKESAKVLAKPVNKIYMKRFLIMLHEKIKIKMKLLPGLIDDKGYETIKDFKAFDDRYTAPIHGFKNAEDYWEKCSSKPHLPNIKIPALIVNAINDPFLPEACFPLKEAGANKNLTLLMPNSGGHVGFVSFNRQNLYWSEKQAVNFLN